MGSHSGLFFPLVTQFQFVKFSQTEKKGKDYFLVSALQEIAPQYDAIRKLALIPGEEGSREEELEESLRRGRKASQRVKFLSGDGLPSSARPDRKGSDKESDSDSECLSLDTLLHGPATISSSATISSRRPTHHPAVEHHAPLVSKKLRQQMEDDRKLGLWEGADDSSPSDSAGIVARAAAGEGDIPSFDSQQQHLEKEVVVMSSGSRSSTAAGGWTTSRSARRRQGRMKGHTHSHVAEDNGEG